MQVGFELFAAKRNSADCVMCVRGGTKGLCRVSEGELKDCVVCQRGN